MLCYGVVRELAKVCVWRRRANVVDEKQGALCDLDVMVRELHVAWRSWRGEIVDRRCCDVAALSGPRCSLKTQVGVFVSAANTDSRAVSPLWVMKFNKQSLENFHASGQ
jgi:hypothetical protein